MQFSGETQTATIQQAKTRPRRPRANQRNFA